jgi:hypothetical protein
MQMTSDSPIVIQALDKTASNSETQTSLYVGIFCVQKHYTVHAVKKNTEALVVASKEIELKVNADKIKYMAMPRDQNAKKKKITI